MLKNFWYAVEESKTITRQPKKVVVMGQDLVLFRKSTGQVAALSNICIHRGAALSGGWLDGDCIRCPYHGWKFDGEGACHEIPANVEGIPIPKKARVDAYPVEERYGWVWVFLGDLPAEQRPPIPEVPEFGQPGWKAIYGEFTWKAHYSRVVENGIDIAHTHWVHRNSFGNIEHPQVEDYEVTTTDTSAAFSVMLMPPLPKGIWKYVRRKRNPVQASVAVYMPSITRLHLKFGKWETIVIDSNIPIDEHTTLTRYIQLRNFFTGDWADGDSAKRMMKIFLEDQPTVESQNPELLPYDIGAELHLKSDAMAVAYRRLRKRYIDMGWGIDMDAIRQEHTGKSAVVIPSPARRNPQESKTWVVSEVPLIQLGRPSQKDLDVHGPS
jgi:phenylpropionate dioxygenase-like ring-hydroxylating dioxygenase large terminal subunit